VRIIELENNAKYLISILKHPNSDDFETSRDYSDNFNNRYENTKMYENYIYKKKLLNKNIDSFLLVTFLRDAKVKAEKKKLKEKNSVHLARKGKDFIAFYHRSRRIRPKQKRTNRKRTKQKRTKRKKTKKGRKRNRRKSIKEVLNNFLALNI